MATGTAGRDAILLAAATLAIHMAANPHFGFFRDELYFIVCGRHPDWGYVDQPPIVPLLAAASQLGGVSLVAIRAIPAFFAAATIYVTCLLVRQMGGDRFAVVLAALGTALAPVLLSFGTKLGPDTVELLGWPLAVLCVARAAERDPRWWLAAGATLGVAAEAKYSALLCAASLVLGILATRRRTALRSPWPWLGMLAGAAILLPNALWQGAEGFPMLELLRNGQHGKNVVLDPGQFLLQELALTNPALSLIWLAGLGWCLRSAAWRWLGLGFAALLALMILLHGKAYYPAAIYPCLFAAGGVALSQLSHAHPGWRAGLLAAAGVFGCITAPMVLPILPEPQMAAYLGGLARAGFGVGATEHHKQAVLGQDFADMHGWQELADQVAALHAALPDEIRDRTQVIGGNYGEAGALDVLAPPGTLPPALSSHNQYWLWGPRAWDGTAIIDIGGDIDKDRELCASAELIGTFHAAYVMPYEDDLPIILCRDLKLPVSALWPGLKNYN